MPCRHYKEEFSVKDIAKKAGDGVSGAAKKAGGGVATAAKKTGQGLKTVGGKIGGFFGGIFSWLGKLKWVFSCVLCLCALSFLSPVLTPLMTGIGGLFRLSRAAAATAAVVAAPMAAAATTTSNAAANAVANAAANSVTMA